MTLQASGTIGVNDLVTEYGGTAPHAMSEYYRGTTLCLTSVTAAQTVYENGAYSNNTHYAKTTEFDDATWNGSRARWYGSILYYNRYNGGMPNFSYGGWTYYRNGNGFSNGIGRYQTQNVTTQKNVNVPSSGTLSLTHFYGQGNT